jgi:hypothetical protein
MFNTISARHSLPPRPPQHSQIIPLIYLPYRERYDKVIMKPLKPVCYIRASPAACLDFDAVWIKDSMSIRNLLTNRQALRRAISCSSRRIGFEISVRGVAYPVATGCIRKGMGTDYRILVP